MNVDNIATATTTAAEKCDNLDDRNALMKSTLEIVNVEAIEHKQRAREQ